MNHPNPTPRFRFDLKMLIAAISVIAVLLAIFSRPFARAREQQQAIDHIVQLHGEVSGGLPLDSERLLGASLVHLFFDSLATPQALTVNLSASQVHDVDLKELSKLQHVRKLCLHRTAISDAGLKHLRGLNHLVELDLSETGVSDQGVSGLARIRSLASLNVDQTKVSYSALRRLDKDLPNAHFAEQLAAENLKEAGVQVVDVPRLLDSPEGVTQAGAEVQDVIVGMNKKLVVTEKMLIDLSQLDSLPELRIHDIEFGPEGLAPLAELPLLKTFEIYHANLRDSDLRFVALQKQVEELEIYGCESLTGDELLQLTSLPHLKRLKIWECRGIPGKRLDELEQQLPNCVCEFSRH